VTVRPPSRIAPTVAGPQPPSSHGASAQVTASRRPAAAIVSFSVAKAGSSTSAIRTARVSRLSARTRRVMISKSPRRRRWAATMTSSPEAVNASAVASTCPVMTVNRRLRSSGRTTMTSSRALAVLSSARSPRGPATTVPVAANGRPPSSGTAGPIAPPIDPRATVYRWEVCVT
jgi:hypothetical protein